MPLLTKDKATERLVSGEEVARETVLSEVTSELFPERPRAASPAAEPLVQSIRHRLEREEIVDLWKVPAGREVTD